MNEKGQLLSYDAILALVILFTVIVMTTYILEENVGTAYDYNYAKPMNTLEILEETDENLLLTLSYSLKENNTEKINRTLDKIKVILDAECLNYTFKENNHNQILLSSNNIDNTKQAYSSRKIVNEYTFELEYFI